MYHETTVKMYHETVEEALLGRIDRLLEHFQRLMDLLDAIASYVQPPLPLPIMAAAVIFAINGRIPARLAAAWGRVVRWANSVLEPADPSAQRGTFVSGLAHSVVWVQIILSPFKLEDAEAFRIRAEIAEAQRAIAEAGRATAEEERAIAEAGRATAEEERAVAEAGRATAEEERDTLRITVDSERETSQQELGCANVDLDIARADYSSLKNKCDAFLRRARNQMQ